ncbi:MAG: 2-hydroxyacyl-CoA dehydratase family protein [Thermoplasmatota archaeon]
MAESENERKVGITTTVPLEPFLASGKLPVDLNNLFISSSDANYFVEEAQVRGYPRNICTWIKGLYTASDDIDSVVGVVRGDCSNTESLLETLKRKGKSVHSFSYPANRSRKTLISEIEELCSFLGTTFEEAEGKADELEELRKLARAVDEARWKHLRITALEAHLVQVSTSDLNSDPGVWREYALKLLEDEEGREPEPEGPRLGYVGVPPIITDIFPVTERMGANTVFFETQRQFTMPSGSGDWIQRYLDYTYPYEIGTRVEDVRRNIDGRRIDGIVHYVQSFCHRQIDDIIFRKELDIPLLTVEGNLPGPMDERTKIRLEAFLDILRGES